MSSRDPSPRRRGSLPPHLVRGYVLPGRRYTAYTPTHLTSHRQHTYTTRTHRLHTYLHTYTLPIHRLHTAYTPSTHHLHTYTPPTHLYTIPTHYQVYQRAPPVVHLQQSPVQIWYIFLYQLYVEIALLSLDTRKLLINTHCDQLRSKG